MIYLNVILMKISILMAPVINFIMPHLVCVFLFFFEKFFCCTVTTSRVYVEREFCAWVYVAQRLHRGLGMLIMNPCTAMFCVALFSLCLTDLSGINIDNICLQEQQQDKQLPQ